MKKEVIIILILLIIPFISATCKENQIDINTASLSELDQLTGIGPVKAESIINSRPFNTLDELVNAYGIGPATLQTIKTQNLACVEEETENSSESTEKQTSPEKPEQENTQNTNNPQKTITSQTIKLNSESQKTIKTENNSEDSIKSKFTIYGLIAFCILLTFLFLIKKRKYKNEFRE